MPIPQNFNRFIGPVAQEEIPEEYNVPESELFDQETEIEELPDGSAIVKLEERNGPEENPNFYENLADKLTESTLSTIALKYLDLIEKDKEARLERDKQYEEGLIYNNFQ